MVDCGLCLTVGLKSLIIAAGGGEFTASIGKNGLNLPDFNMHKITAAVSAHCPARTLDAMTPLASKTTFMNTVLALFPL